MGLAAAIPAVVDGPARWRAVRVQRKNPEPRDGRTRGETSPAAKRGLPFRIRGDRVDIACMGIDVRLETEAGDEIETLLDFDDSLEKILLQCDPEPSVTLRFIDPYGNTGFNRLQMPALIGEIEQAREHLKGEVAGKFAEQLLRLALRCQDEVNTSLKFYGG